jgi:hypothetical protein
MLPVLLTGILVLRKIMMMELLSLLSILVPMLSSMRSNLVRIFSLFMALMAIAQAVISSFRPVLLLVKNKSIRESPAVSNTRVLLLSIRQPASSLGSLIHVGEVTLDQGFLLAPGGGLP